MGVRVFPEGVAREKSGAEKSKNAERREARAMRRQIARRSRRKRRLRVALVDSGLYPADPASQRKLDTLDPYILRNRALGEPLTLHELGRVFLHLAQRRGFLSNRKTDRDEKEKSETLAAISQLQAELDGRALGQHFAASLAEDPHRPVRGRRTRRSMYLDEFDRIWEAQRAFQPTFLTDALKYGRTGLQIYPAKPAPLDRKTGETPLDRFGIHGLVFFQRPLKPVDTLIGFCELEAGQPRSARAERPAQRFRLLQEVNNLRFIDPFGEVLALDEARRSKLITYLSASKERSFDDIRKHLGLPEDAVFNLERGERKKLLGLGTDHTLSGAKLFGKKSWSAFDEATKDAIAHSLIVDDEAEILRKAVSDWGSSTELAERLTRVHLESGYASYSLIAISRLLPHLERGLPVMANDAADSALHAAGYQRADEQVPNQRDDLPPPPGDIRNPLVKQALFEVRKLVNAILREWGKPDSIHIELAREVQGGLAQRAEQSKRMRDREGRRKAAADKIREHGFTPSRDAIERWLLWEEQGGICLYSGRPISPIQLLGGEADVDHILPYSRSLDNSLANKVVCFTAENSAKGQRTPAEWLQQMDPPRYEAILQRAGKLPLDARRGKLRKIASTEVRLDDFLNRQLSDTAYITRQVLHYVKCLGVPVVAVKGQCTAELRHVWGLDALLRDDALKIKNRDDHRHHAVDALIIALTDPRRLQQLARLRFRRRRVGATGLSQEEIEARFPEPWPTFIADARRVVDAINVSHRPRRKVSGPLHEETLYAPTSKPERNNGQPRPHARNWVEAEGTFSVRKPLTSLTLNEVNKIRDERTRELVRQRLIQHHIDPDTRAGAIPAAVWKEPLRMVGRAGPDASPNAPVIHSVRVLKSDETIRPIRTEQQAAYVKPGNTHRFCLFELPGSSNERPKRTHYAYTTLEAADLVRRRLPSNPTTHPEEPEAAFLFSLSAGEMVRGNINGREGIFRFLTAPSTSGQMVFVLQNDARPAKTRQVFTSMPNTLRAHKIRVDILGRVHLAND